MYLKGGISIDADARPLSNQVALITDFLVHSRQNPEFFSEYEFDILKF